MATKISSGNSSVVMPASVLVHHGQRQVDQDGPETDGQQQHRLVLLLDGQPDKGQPHGVHHGVLPADRGEADE
jgi:hypothetical protein